VEAPPRLAVAPSVVALLVLALAAAVLAVPARPAIAQDGSAPTPGAIDLRVALPGVGADGGDATLVAEGDAEQRRNELGVIELVPSFTPTSIEVSLGPLGPARVGFQVSALGPSTAMVDDATGRAVVVVHVEVAVVDVAVAGDPTPRPVSDCAAGLYLALFGQADPSDGTTTASTTQALASFDPGAQPCAVDGLAAPLAPLVTDLFGGVTDADVAIYAQGPSAPATLDVAGGPLQAHLSWSEPATRGGLPVVRYRVEVVGTDLVVHTAGSVRSIEVIGLQADTSYRFQVSAETRVGWSPPSEPTAEVRVRAPDIAFSDVAADHPFSPEVTWLAEVGVTTGYPDRTFRPEATLTREAMAAFLHRASGSPDVDVPSPSTFSDVSAESAFAEAIEWLATSGITAGYGDGTFRPTEGLTRQAMAAFLRRAAERAGGGPDETAHPDPTCARPAFTDVPAGHAFCGEIAWMAASGITTGYGDGSFRPTESLSRQAMAAFLYRYLLVVPADRPQGVPPDSYWDRMAMCETGGNWAHHPDGQWSGGLGIYRQTWQVWGGEEFAPNAGHATREQQIIVANRIATLGYGRTGPVGYSGWGCVAVVGYP
jgi:hypothetical protein